MRALSLFAAGVAAWLLLPAAAQAQATAEGADRIRLGLKDWIATHLATPDKSVVFNFQGPITVEPQGKSYKAVIPRSEVVFADEGNPSRLALDPVELVLTPLENGWLDTVATIPSTYRVVPAKGDDKGVEVTIGTQALRGVFAPQYHAFMSLDGKLGQITAHSLNPAEAKGAFKIDQIALTGDSKAVGQDTYDSSGTIALSGISFLDETGAQLFRLDGATVEGKAAAADMAARRASSDKLTDRQKRYPPQADGEMPKEFLAELGRVFGASPKLFDDFGFTYGLNGLEVTPGTGDVNKVTLASGGFGVGIAGLAKGASTFRITFDLAQLGIDPLPEFGQFVPHTATVELALTNLPNHTLLQALTGMLDSSATLGPDQAAEIATAQLQQAVLNSNGALEIRSFKASSPLTSIDLTGTLRPNPKAPLMMTGDARLVVTGMEQALEAAKAMPDGQEMVQGLTVLQTMGAQEEVDGKPARTYKLVIGENGDILLNGTDLKPLLGMR
ncbi:hypothetical protein [Inquilinus sp. Marseille-Q2685]|uniref:hypothetical protein n=1 Tax=Inquilinus sp. Marseille-Q2685 TaxID=2866581 RepID=UPI001CE3C615|nr:hypothetical protein [Inquilinus sp. Marseille-Q2685]